MYKNSARSESLIKKATIELLSEKKDISKITVSEIVERAEINRGTFYNHYKDIEDVLNQIEDEVMTTFVKRWEWAGIGETKRFETFIIELTNTFKEKEEVCKKLVQNVPSHIFDDLKIKVSEALANSPTFKNLSKEEWGFLSIVSNGIAGLYLDYFSLRSSFTLEEIGQYAVSIARTVFYDRINSADSACKKGE